ncbi:putative prophage terminase small subunit [Yersinia enterocolitica]|nr:putative prophage terminase small subunit [Yersinia enterocolitica]
MARPDWGAIQEQFLADHAKSNISPKDWCEAQGLNYSTAKRYIKIANANSKSANRSANSQKGKDTKSRQAKESGRNRESGKSHSSPDAKPIRGARCFPPTNPFPSGNQHALKHGGYGRRMLLTDAISEDANCLTLDDELFWLRAASLTAAENIGRWRTELDDDAADDDTKKALRDNISAAEKAMHRNTARIESLEYTKGTIIKMQIDAAYREAATEKVELEIDKMKDGDSDNAIVVHHSLPIPGR